MSQYIVSARKYRPQRFDEVVGQKHVTDTLKNALNKDQLAHAFLFCGPRGVGKTTCARILAKAINCRNPDENYEPCNSCDMCEAMTKNASFNITELDAASNNSVDHMRALIEQTRIPPQGGDYRVFIIDEVHMLSKSAFNSFLKTLEEPPSYAVFILATTEKHKIIPTILSRCQIYDFKRIQVKDMRDHLAYIAGREGIEAEEDALQTIALKADGALRDALSIFDRIVSAVGNEFTYNDVIEQLHILDYDYFFSMTDALIAEDVPSVFTIFDEIIRYGFQPDHFLNGLGSHLRDLLMCQYKDTLDILEFMEGLKERYLSQARTIDKTFLIRCLHIINECDTRYQRAKNKRLHVEMALSHMCFASRYETREITTGEQIKKKQVSVKPGSSQSSTPLQDTPIPSTKLPGEVNEPIPDRTSPKSERTKQKTDSIAEKSATPHIKPDAETIKQKETSRQEPTESESVKTPLVASPDIPSFDSIENLKSQAARERQSRQETRVELTQENLEKFILEWVKTVSSPSTISAIRGSRFTLKNNDEITVFLGSRTDGTIIKNESGLLPDLRVKFMTPKLNLSFAISKELLEKRNADRPLSPSETFEKMKKENPMVQKLQKKLSLKIKS